MLETENRPVLARSRKVGVLASRIEVVNKDVAARRDGEADEGQQPKSAEIQFPFHGRVNTDRLASLFFAPQRAAFSFEQPIGRAGRLFTGFFAFRLRLRLLRGFRRRWRGWRGADIDHPRGLE